MTFLTPLGALVTVAALLPLGAVAFGELRVRAARRTLGLEPPPRSRRALRLALAAGAIALLGLAAAQPALTHTTSAHARTDAAALFVIDTSRSMAASATRTSPTRLDRATAAAIRLRAAIPDVPAGIATLTDRVLPDLLPVPDVSGFDGVARRAVAIESPPPSETSSVATSYAALHQVASGDYFPPQVKHRLVILLTDGESAPFNTAQVAKALPASRGYRLLSIRFWNADEAIYDADGRIEPGYHPNPIGATLLNGLATATGGRSFSEGEIGAAGSELRALAGSGPTVAAGEIVQSQQPLAPFVAAAAGLLLLASVMPADAVARALRPRRSRPWRIARILQRNSVPDVKRM